MEVKSVTESAVEGARCKKAVVEKNHKKEASSGGERPEQEEEESGKREFGRAQDYGAGAVEPQAIEEDVI